MSEEANRPEAEPALGEAGRKKILEYIQSGDCPVHLYPVYRWWMQRRKAQVCPNPVPTIWFLLGGRGSGKTWTASNHIYDYCVRLPYTTENDIVYIALVGATFEDVKNTMVEGKSGLLNVIPEENLINWNRTSGELKFFIREDDKYREVRANTYTAERPEKLRGPNTHVAWLDEMAKFRDADKDPTKAGTTFNNMMLGLRLGTEPHVIVTGTPTPCKLVKYLLEHPDMKLSHMTTLDNAKNLPKSFLDELLRLRPGSRTYDQEVLAKVLLDNPDAIFSQEIIDDNREALPDDPEIKVLKVLGYDPAASSSPDADECGIIVTGYTPEVQQRTAGRPIVIKPIHAYILKDLSGHFTPSEQTQKVIKTMLADKIDDLVFEQNQGVEFVMGALEQAIKDNTIEYKKRGGKKPKKTDYGIVKKWDFSGTDLDGEPFKFSIFAIHAVSGKTLRAEMVSGRYDSNQVHHPVDPLPTCELQNCNANLEFQMTSWDPVTSKNSPDRLDAMVYTLLHIFSGNGLLTHGKVTISRPPADVDQMSSEHGAVRKRGKSKAGIYSLDIPTGNPTDVGDRSLIPYLESENFRGESIYWYSRDVR